MRASTTRRKVSSALGLLALLAHATATATANAAEPPAAEAPAREPDDASKTHAPVAEGSPPEEPPPAPYEKTLVLDASLGARAFVGDMARVATPGMWLHAQLGYELLRWLMLFGEGDLSFSDTSRAQPAPRTRAFPILGFGGGARFTARMSPRFGAYAQVSVGAMKADVPVDSLALIGFREAEALGPYAGLRLGAEWYQIDRHLALGLNAGLRLAQGFAPSLGDGAAPLVLDGGVSLRYAF